MSRPLRLEYPGSFWHITQRGNEQRSIFVDDCDRVFMLDLFGKAVSRFGWIVYTYTLMSNHYHCVIELTREKTLSRGMQLINGTYAQAFNRRHHRVGHLFQGRFDSRLIEKEAYFLNVLRYVVLNPVRAQMVQRPEDYAWSSYRAIIGESPAPAWLAVDQVLAAFASDPTLARAEYRQFVNAAISDTAKLWEGLVGQIYLGSAEWIERVSQKIESQPRSDEYPREQRHPATVTISAILALMASVLGISEETIRHGRGGTARMLTAWLAYQEGALDLRTIAAALGLRSTGGVSKLIAECETTISIDPEVAEAAARCSARLRTAT